MIITWSRRDSRKGLQGPAPQSHKSARGGFLAPQGWVPGCPTRPLPAPCLPQHVHRPRSGPSAAPVTTPSDETRRTRGAPRETIVLNSKKKKKNKREKEREKHLNPPQRDVGVEIGDLGRTPALRRAGRGNCGRSVAIGSPISRTRIMMMISWHCLEH